jgi:hypothetical protein
MKPILCLDFDGVLHSYTSGWKGARLIPDPPVPGALEFVATAPVRFRVHILSSRPHQWGGRRAMKRWLRGHYIALGNAEDTPEWWLKHIHAAGGMEPWPQAVEAATDMLMSCIGWPLFKPSAMVTIDDRALTFTGQWPALADIAAFKPWNKSARPQT